MPIQALAADSAEALASAPGTTIIYKHSPTCSLCWTSIREVQRVADEDDLNILQVNVFTQRAISDAIASHFSVRHESPQILILEDGALVWHASHRAVTADRIRAALSGAREGIGARF